MSIEVMVDSFVVYDPRWPAGLAQETMAALRGAAIF
jgi:hypothetical protein